MVSFEGNFLVPLDARFAASDTPEGADLKLPAITFFVEPYQQVIGRSGPIGNIEIERWPALLHNVFGCSAFDISIPMLVP